MNLKVLQYIGLIILIILAFSKIKNCSTGDKSKTDTIITVKYDTTWKTKIEKTPVYTPGPTQILPGDTQYLPVDTAAILKNFYSKVYYNDTLLIDSFGYVAYHDMVTENKIAKRQKESNYKIPVVTKTVEKEIHHYYKQPRQFNAGFLVDPLKLRLSGLVSYEDKKDHIFHLGVTTSQQGSSIIGGMSWKIKMIK
jgi:hypothetical protein